MQTLKVFSRLFTILHYAISMYGGGKYATLPNRHKRERRNNKEIINTASLINTKAKPGRGGCRPKDEDDDVDFGTDVGTNPDTTSFNTSALSNTGNDPTGTPQKRCELVDSSSKPETSNISQLPPSSKSPGIFSIQLNQKLAKIRELLKNKFTFSLRKNGSMEVLDTVENKKQPHKSSIGSTLGMEMIARKGVFDYTKYDKVIRRNSQTNYCFQCSIFMNYPNKGYMCNRQGKYKSGLKGCILNPIDISTIFCQMNSLYNIPHRAVCSLCYTNIRDSRISFAIMAIDRVLRRIGDYVYHSRLLCFLNVLSTNKDCEALMAQLISSAELPLDQAYHLLNFASEYTEGRYKFMERLVHKDYDALAQMPPELLFEKLLSDRNWSLATLRLLTDKLDGTFTGHLPTDKCIDFIRLCLDRNIMSQSLRTSISKFIIAVNGDFTCKHIKSLVLLFQKHNIMLRMSEIFFRAGLKAQISTSTLVSIQKRELPLESTKPEQLRHFFNVVYLSDAERENVANVFKILSCFKVSTRNSKSDISKFMPEVNECFKFVCMNKFTAENAKVIVKQYIQSKLDMPTTLFGALKGVLARCTSAQLNAIEVLLLSAGQYQLLLSYLKECPSTVNPMIISRFFSIVIMECTEEEAIECIKYLVDLNFVIGSDLIYVVDTYITWHPNLVHNLISSLTPSQINQSFKIDGIEETLFKRLSARADYLSISYIFPILSNKKLMRSLDDKGRDIVLTYDIGGYADKIATKYPTLLAGRAGYYYDFPRDFFRILSRFDVDAEVLSRIRAYINQRIALRRRKHSQ